MLRKNNTSLDVANPLNSSPIPSHTIAKGNATLHYIDKQNEAKMLAMEYRADFEARGQFSKADKTCKFIM